MLKSLKNNDSFCNKKITFTTAMYAAFLLAAALWFHGLLCDPLKIQHNVFFHDFNDLLADFFNHIIYSSDGSPYLTNDISARDRILPPLHYLLAMGVRHLIDCPMTLEAMWKSKTALSCAAAFMTFSEVFLLFMLSKLIEGKNKFTPLLIILFSGVNIFAVERGTMAVFTAGCIAGFLHYYECPEKNRQLFSLILLSLAASLKIYPALFGVFLLKKRDFRAILFCILLTSALGFLPMLAFEGEFSNIPILFSNLAKYRAYYELSYQEQILRGFLIHRFHIAYYTEIIIFLRVMVDIIAISALCTAFLSNNREQLALAAASVITLCPTGAAPYTQCYLFIPFMLFLNDVKNIQPKCRTHTCICVCMAIGYFLLLMPYQFPGEVNELFIRFILPAMLMLQLAVMITELKMKTKTACCSSESSNKEIDNVK